MDGSLQNKCYIFAFSGRRWKVRGGRGAPDTRDSSFLTPFPSCLSRTPATPVLCLPSLAWKTQKYNACSVDWLTETLLSHLSLWTPARKARGTPRKMIPSTTVSFVQQKRITSLQRIQTLRCTEREILLPGYPLIQSSWFFQWRVTKISQINNYLFFCQFVLLKHLHYHCYKTCKVMLLVTVILIYLVMKSFRGFYFIQNNKELKAVACW